MSKEAATAGRPLTAFEQMRYAGEILKSEASAITAVAGRLDEQFCQAVQLLLTCRGNAIVCGMGKAGLVGQKIAATLASTGTRSHFLHPGEAFHGDLGRIHHGDVVLMLSQSGETEEVVRLLPSLANLGVPMVAITASHGSKLGRAATVTLALGQIDEACSLGLAPSSSTTAMLALGDALSLVTSRMRDFRAEDFAKFHPGGALGLKLSRVDEHMRPLVKCRVADSAATVREVIVRCTKPGRRTGAIMLTGEQGRLAGIFTDSDLARLFEIRCEKALDGPISAVMTLQPATVVSGQMMSDALRVLADRKISELPVVDSGGRPVGLIDVTDVVGLLPDQPQFVQPESSDPKTPPLAPDVRIYANQQQHRGIGA